MDDLTMDKIGRDVVIDASVRCPECGHHWHEVTPILSRPILVRMIGRHYVREVLGGVWPWAAAAALLWWSFR